MLIGAGVFCAAGVLLNAVAYNHARAMMHFTAAHGSPKRKHFCSKKRTGPRQKISQANEEPENLTCDKRHAMCGRLLT
jgi:hypothetical protein